MSLVSQFSILATAIETHSTQYHSVTSVGATTQFGPETAATFSGGGFSNYFARPSWQSTQVSSYLSTHGSAYTGLFNASGRGYPDISAQGVDFEIILVETGITASGTSCSTPTVASIIALLNDQLIAAGKPVLGFLNPWLYSNAASALTDITEGNSPGCNTAGWSAAAGWDPVRFSNYLLGWLFMIVSDVDHWARDTCVLSFVEGSWAMIVI